MRSKIETRRSSRINEKIKVVSRIHSKETQKIALVKDKFFKATAVDINTLGIGIYSKYFLPQGTIIELGVNGKNFRIKGLMRIKGEIKYSKYIQPNQYRSGIEFIKLPKEYKDAIKQFMQAYDQRKEPRLKLPV